MIEESVNNGPRDVTPTLLYAPIQIILSLWALMTLLENTNGRQKQESFSDKFYITHAKKKGEVISFCSFLDLKSERPCLYFLPIFFL